MRNNNQTNREKTGKSTYEDLSSAVNHTTNTMIINREISFFLGTVLANVIDVIIHYLEIQVADHMSS